MPTNLTATPNVVLSVRTDLKAGTTWTYVPNLTRNNKQYACPAACPSGWTGAADVNTDLCECN